MHTGSAYKSENCVPAMIVTSTNNREAKKEIHQWQRRKAVRIQLTDVGRRGKCVGALEVTVNL
jgi:hypothetical protein